MVMSRRLHGVAVYLVSGALCLAALTGCGGTTSHLVARRRHANAVDHAVTPTTAPEFQPVAAPARGPSVPEALLWRGNSAGAIKEGYPLLCGVYPGVGYAASLHLPLPGRVATLSVQFPTYKGPGVYRIGTRDSTDLALASLTGMNPAKTGTVTVAAGGRGGTMNVEFGFRGSGHSGHQDSLSGSWSCATPGAGAGASVAPPSSNANESLTVSGAFQGYVDRAAVPSGQLVAGTPNCSAYGSGAGSKFNLSMVVTWQGQPYILEVQLQQYQGAGMYYPSFTTQSLPIATNWATAEVIRYPQPAATGKIPSSIWAAVGGDFRLDPGLTQGRMAIRFMNRTGDSFIVTGSWSC